MASMDLSWPSAAHNISLYEPGIRKHIAPMLSTYHHIPVLLAIYLAIVKYYGPKYMQNRPPHDLKWARMAYNLIQIAMNVRILAMCLSLIGLRVIDPWGNGCFPVTTVSTGPAVFDTAVKIAYSYYLNKLFDCLETVFFVLRKKQSQVSFLHLYHHVIMVYSIWLSIFYFREENLVQIAAVNSLVHVVMYIYYFLSSLGPGMQKYLWWKKYITRLQLIQFLAGMTTLLKMAVSGCYNDGRFVIMWVLNSTTLFSLFVQFYVNTYKTKMQ